VSEHNPMIPCERCDAKTAEKDISRVEDEGGLYLLCQDCCIRLYGLY
jgi:hypothetical protein